LIFFHIALAAAVRGDAAKKACVEEADNNVLPTVTARKRHLDAFMVFVVLRFFGALQLYRQHVDRKMRGVSLSLSLSLSLAGNEGRESRGAEERKRSRLIFSRRPFPRKGRYKTSVHPSFLDIPKIALISSSSVEGKLGCNNEVHGVAGGAGLAIIVAGRQQIGRCLPFIGAAVTSPLDSRLVVEVLARVCCYCRRCCCRPNKDAESSCEPNEQ
jgi:hypothetical protein